MGVKTAANKHPHTFYLHPDVSKKVDMAIAADPQMSRSDFVEDAINFYSGVVETQENRSFLGDEIIKAMKAIVHDAEGRIFSHFRSQDISLSMLAVLFAASLSGLSKPEIDDLRQDAVEYVDNNFRAKSFVVAWHEERDDEEDDE